MIQLELEAEVEANLAAQAQAHGQALASYVEEILLAHLQDDEDLNEGLADIAAGRTRPAREVFDELHERYGIRG